MGSTADGFDGILLFSNPMKVILRIVFNQYNAFGYFMALY